MNGKNKKCLSVAVAVLAVGTFSHGVTLAQALPNCGCMDVVLVIDDTGSMGPAINNVKAGLGTIIQKAIDVSKGDLQMGLVSFSDTIDVDQPLTNNIAAVQAAVNALVASGGAGEPEASDEALNLVVTGASACTVNGGPFDSFRAGCVKIVVLVTDARPAGCDDNYQDGVDDTNAHTVALAAAGGGFLVSAVLVDNGSQITGAHPGGVEPDVMSDYAATTGGDFITVPADGTGTDSAIWNIIANCGGPGAPIPAVSEWGIVVMVLMLLTGAKLYFGRRRATTA